MRDRGNKRFDIEPPECGRLVRAEGVKPATCRRSGSKGMERPGQPFSRLHVHGHAYPNQLDEVLGVPVGQPEATV